MKATLILLSSMHPLKLDMHGIRSEIEKPPFTVLKEICGLGSTMVLICMLFSWGP